ncbi:MAG TPA: hypothetical protein K8U79_01690 [Clostridium perfringens]|nr:hypothetical protein [Clostridium perfringens]
MTKFKNVLTYFILLLIIIISFIVPLVMIRLQENKLLAKDYTINSNIQNVDENNIQAELIKTIYSIYNNVQYNVSVSDYFMDAEKLINIENNNVVIEDESNILNKVDELVKRNIIKQEFYEQFSKGYVIYRVWDYDSGLIQYSKINIYTNDDYENAIASFEIENETNKIINFTVKKEYITNNEETLQEYIKYLKLDNSIDDWIYEDNSLKSRIAGITIKMNNDGEFIAINTIPQY